MEAYCVKCREKRNIKDTEASYNAKGAPVTRGICEVCGTKVYRMGRTEAHEGIEKPVIKPKPIVREGNLVVVESPAKAKTVGRFLGNTYTVKASVGHVRDLLRSQLSVDIENDFEPKYRVPNDKRQVVKEIKNLADKKEIIYLATDPDREGEAIAWHLMESAEMDESRVKRVVFHEITRNAVAEAFSNPRKIDMDLVDAQQARRVLDRLVGYGISPILWSKVRSRLSAGRVQSVALRIVVEREREIEAFVPVEYWSIAAEFLPEGYHQSYVAKLIRIDEKEFNLPDAEETEKIIADMQPASYKIREIKIGQRKKNPNAPFITSSLQQEASRKLGYTTRRTMALAQQLYEGIDIGNGGATGLITYMRTDSTTVSPMAIKEVRSFIKNTYGPEFLPANAQIYKTRTVAAQEAHEAIRPTSVMVLPDVIKEKLTRDQYRLYKLIWQRFVASQMEAAVFDTIAVDIAGEGKLHQYLLRATGSKLRFQGFLIVYQETRDEDKPDEDEENVEIPIESLMVGQKQILKAIIPEQHFTQPPPRFTDASLIQILEENGIGRPSTYAPIISTIQERGYVVRETKRLFPTEIGFIVNDLIVEYFPEVVDIGFTSKMEEKLDDIAEGKQEWVNVIRDFYLPFEKRLENAHKHMPENKAPLEEVGRSCPKCGNELVVRFGKYGKFISCSNFPSCRYTEPWLEKIDVACPICESGEIVERRTKRGRIFYGCSRFPDCDFSSWKRPISTKCPNCGGTLVELNKKEAQCLACEKTYLLNKLAIQEEQEA